MKRRFAVTLLAASALVFAAAAGAQDIKERTLKVGLQNPKGHPAVMGAEKFAEIVTAKSGGSFSATPLCASGPIRHATTWRSVGLPTFSNRKACSPVVGRV